MLGDASYVSLYDNVLSLDHNFPENSFVVLTGYGGAGAARYYKVECDSYRRLL
jgi:hypothetical protein